MANKLRNPMEQAALDIQGQAYKTPEFERRERTTSQGDLGGDSRFSGEVQADGLLPPPDLSDAFMATAEQYNVPVNVLMALAHQESRYRPDAIGIPTKWGRAKGMMQYIDPTAESMGINPLDPMQALDAAAKQFAQRIGQGYSVEEAIMAHHGGDDRAQWGPKTQRYGQEVMAKAGKIFELAGPHTQQPQPENPRAFGESGIPYKPAPESPDQAGPVDGMTGADRKPRPAERGLSGQPDAPQEPAQRPQDAGQAHRARMDGQRREQAAIDQDGPVDAMSGADRQIDPWARAAREEATRRGKATMLTDLGNLLQIGHDRGVLAFREGIRQVFGEKVVNAIDKVDEWMNDESTVEMFERQMETNEGELSQETFEARKKDWITEDKDGYGFGPAWGDWRSYASGMIESLPETAVTMLPGAVLAKGVYVNGLSRGLSVAQAGRRAATTATIAGSLTEGFLGGGASAREVRDAIEGMSKDQLKDSDALQSMMMTGLSFEEARKQLADNASSKAFLMAGVLTGVFGGQGDRVLAKLLTKGSKNRWTAAMRGAFAEGLLEELPQEAAQQTAENVAMQDADPKIPTFANVPNAAAGGAVAGMGMGAGFGALAGGERNPASILAKELNRNIDAAKAQGTEGEALRSLDPSGARPEPAATGPDSNPDPLVYENSEYNKAQWEADWAEFDRQNPEATLNGNVAGDTGPAPAGSIERSIKEAAREEKVEAVQGERVRVVSPTGEVSGVVQGYREDGTGAFEARILGDDGMPYVFNEQDGVKILRDGATSPGDQSVEAGTPAEGGGDATASGSDTDNGAAADGAGGADAAPGQAAGETARDPETTRAMSLGKHGRRVVSFPTKGDAETFDHARRVNTLRRGNVPEDDPEMRATAQWVRDVARVHGISEQAVGDRLLEYRRAIMEQARGDTEGRGIEAPAYDSGDTPGRRELERQPDDSRFERDPLDMYKFATPNPRIRISESRKENRSTGRGTFIAVQPGSSGELARGATLEETFAKAEQALEEFDKNAARAQRAEDARALRETPPQQQSDETAPTGEPIVLHTTKRGKTLRGVVRQIPKEQATSLDPYTFKKDGGWFIREKHLGEASAPAAAPTTEPAPQDSGLIFTDRGKPFSSYEQAQRKIKSRGLQGVPEQAPGGGWGIRVTPTGEDAVAAAGTDGRPTRNWPDDLREAETFAIGRVEDTIATFRAYGMDDAADALQGQYDAAKAAPWPAKRGDRLLEAMERITNEAPDFPAGVRLGDTPETDGNPPIMPKREGERDEPEEPKQDANTTPAAEESPEALTKAALGGAEPGQIVKFRELNTAQDGTTAVVERYYDNGDVQLKLTSGASRRISRKGVEGALARAKGLYPDHDGLLAEVTDAEVATIKPPTREKAPASDKPSIDNLPGMQNVTLRKSGDAFANKDVTLLAAQNRNLTGMSPVKVYGGWGLMPRETARKEAQQAEALNNRLFELRDSLDGTQMAVLTIEPNDRLDSLADTTSKANAKHVYMFDKDMADTVLALLEEQNAILDDWRGATLMDGILNRPVPEDVEWVDVGTGKTVFPGQMLEGGIYIEEATDEYVATRHRDSGIASDSGKRRLEDLDVTPKASFERALGVKVAPGSKPAPASSEENLPLMTDRAKSLLDKVRVGEGFTTGDVARLAAATRRGEAPLVPDDIQRGSLLTQGKNPLGPRANFMEVFKRVGLEAPEALREIQRRQFNEEHGFPAEDRATPPTIPENTDVAPPAAKDDPEALPEPEAPVETDADGIVRPTGRKGWRSERAAFTALTKMDGLGKYEPVHEDGQRWVLKRLEQAPLRLRAKTTGSGNYQTELHRPDTMEVETFKRVIHQRASGARVAPSGAFAVVSPEQAATIAEHLGAPLVDEREVEDQQDAPLADTARAMVSALTALTYNHEATPADLLRIARMGAPAAYGPILDRLERHPDVLKAGVFVHEFSRMKGGNYESVVEKATGKAVDNGTIKINLSYLRAVLEGRSTLPGTSPAEAIAEVLTHELIHAGTATALRESGKESEIARNVAAIQADIKAWMAENGEALSKLDAKTREHLRIMATDPLELPTYGMSARRVQDVLRKIPSQRHGDVWSRFVEAVRTFLGLTEQSATALDDVLAISEKMMDLREQMTGEAPALTPEQQEAVRKANVDKRAAQKHREHRDRVNAEAKPKASENTIFTEDAAEKARALLKARLGRLNTGIDPEMMQAGITLAGYHIEKGARTFAAYARAMVDDLGDEVRPYLKSWYMGVKYDPRATGFDGMDDAATVEAADETAPLAEDAPADLTPNEVNTLVRQLEERGLGAKVVKDAPMLGRLNPVRYWRSKGEFSFAIDGVDDATVTLTVGELTALEQGETLNKRTEGAQPFDVVITADEPPIHVVNADGVQVTVTRSQQDPKRPFKVQARDTEAGKTIATYYTPTQEAAIARAETFRLPDEDTTDEQSQPDAGGREPDQGGSRADRQQRGQGGSAQRDPARPDRAGVEAVPPGNVEGSATPGDRASDGDGGAEPDVAGAGSADRQRNAEDGGPADRGTGAPDAGAGRKRAPRNRVTPTREPENVSPANPGPGNWHYDNPLDAVGGGPVARFNRNKAALETYLEVRDGSREATREEQAIIAGYTGWGSFGQELFQGTWERPMPKAGWEARDQWLRDHLGEDEWKGMQRSIINAHYTDPPTVMTMWGMLEKMGFQGGRVLEPAMGIGNFFGMMPLELANRSQLTGIELDPITGGMAQKLYPDANVKVMGYQKSQTPDHFYDVVIGNWPFENSPIADRRYNKLNPMVHDYFYLKALDQVRPGGIVMAITSAGSMDKKDARIRREMAKKAELVAAYRLPSGAFKDYAGTNVVTDIIILRKRSERAENVNDEGWIQSAPMDTKAGTPVQINEYYHAHPENVLGAIDWGHGTTSGQPGMIVHRPDNLEQRLAALVEDAPEGAYRKATREDRINYVTNHTADREGSLTKTSDGFYVVRGEQLAPAHEVIAYKVKSEKTTAEREAQFEALIDLRQQYAALIEAERDAARNPEPERKALKKAYDAFVKKNGPLNTSWGLTYLDKLDDPFASSLQALERKEGKTWVPATILERSTIRTAKRIESPTVEEAYVLARNGNVNPSLEEIAERAGATPEEVRQTLLDAGAVFTTPGGDIEPSDIYLAGNVRQKLRDAEAALAEGVEGMQRNVDALREVMPADIPYFNIEVQFGASWVPLPVYEQFVAHMLNLESTKGVEVRYDMGRWKVKLAAGFNRRQEAQTGFGTRVYPFSQLVNAAISNQTVTIKKTESDGNGGTREVVNREETDEANNKIAEIRSKFGDWLWDDADRREAMETEYNEVRNSYASPRYDGSFLRFEGMALTLGDGPFNLREHQANAIWRGLVTRRGLYGHEVGTGKSFTLAGIAVESRRYGLARKPLIFAHNANSASVAADINVMYPAAKVLYIDNLKPAQIERRLRQIANDDWDAVVLPHSLMDRMSFKEDTLMAMAAEDIEALEREAYEAAQEDGAELKPEMLKDPDALKRLRSPTAKSLVKQRNRIIEKIQKQSQKASRANAMTFEDLGVDMVLVDEVHEFKKPPITTKMRVKGLQTNTSDRALQLRFITDYIRANNNGANVHTFTGTPITNTLVEIFHQMRFIMKEEMEAAGVDQWDGWFGSFAKEVQDVELDGAGEWETVSRLRAFINVAELRRLVGLYMDVVFSDDMPEMQPRKTASGKTLNDPTLTEAERDELLNGRTEGAADRPYKQVITDTADLTEAQKGAFRVAQERSAQWKRYSGRERKDASDAGMPEAPMQVEGYVAKASFDARLVNDEALAGMEGQVPDEPDSKLSRAIKNVLEIYNSDPLATQAVFSDSGISKTASRSVRDSSGAVVRDDNGVQKRTIKVFSSMHDMIERLVQAGIPRHEIALVDGNTKKSKRKEIAEAMNRSEIRVVIGSTQALGVGVNMQKNLRAMHHMDAPYMPGDLEQRNGRGKRQGNQWNTVKEFRYITDRLDGRRWQILSIKQQFIEKFLHADDNTRVIEGDAADDEQSDILATFSEAAGDPRILIRAKLEGQLEQLKKRERLHEQGTRDARRTLAESTDHLRIMQMRRQRWADTGVMEAAEQAIKTNAGKAFSMEIDGTTYRDRKEAEEAIKKFLRQEIKKGDRDVAIGSYGGLTILASWGNFATAPHFEIAIAEDQFETGAASVASLEGTLRNLPQQLDSLNERITKTERSIERLEQVKDQPFDRADKLAATERQLEALERDLDENPVPPPAWLRQGAPVDTDIQWKGATHTVTGHRWTPEGWFVLADNAASVGQQIPYDEVYDEQGMRLYEDRPFEAPEVHSDIPADLRRRYGVGKTAVLPDPDTGEEVAAEITRAPFREGKGIFVTARYPNGVKQVQVAEGEREGGPKSISTSPGGQTPEQVGARLSNGPGARFYAALEKRNRITLHPTAASTGRAIPGTTAGFVDGNGRIHLVAENIQPGGELGVLMHEAFHNTVRPLVGEAQWQALQGRLRRLYQQARRSKGSFHEAYRAARARVQTARAAGDTLNEAAAVEEFGAYAVEEFENAPASLRKWVESAVGVVKDWIARTLGLQLGRVTPAQLRAMTLAGMRRRAEQGPRPPRGRARAQSNAFRAWFGDSKVVNEKGEPEVVYHGTGTTFNEFKTQNGAYFTRDDSYASAYATHGGNGGAAQVLPVYLRLENPLVIGRERFWTNIRRKLTDRQRVAQGLPSRLTNTAWLSEERIAELKRQGYDGIINDAWNEMIVFDPEQVKSAIANQGTYDPASADIRLSVADTREQQQRADAALDEAIEALDEAAPPAPAVGSVIADMSRPAKFIAHPRTIASLHKPFQPVYQTGINQFEMRDAIIDDLYQGYRVYNRLNDKHKAHVNKVLELGRLLGRTYTEADLQAGIEKPATVPSMAFDENGQPQVIDKPLHAELTTDGEVVTLTAEEIQAYLALREMFDNALDMFRDQTLEDYGMAQFAGLSQSARAITESIDDNTPADQVERLRNIARFVNEIEQAKRTGYVPFTRYGDYVIVVKERKSDITFSQRGEGWLMKGEPVGDIAAALAEVGATEHSEGWLLSKEAKQAIEKLNEETVYSTKIETGLRDVWAKRKSMDAIQREDYEKGRLDRIPAVRKAIEKTAKEWVGNDPMRRVVAFESAKVSGGNTVSLSDLDALAELSSIDNATWDAVREQLADTIKGLSFRKHFFQAANVPGYDADFERSITDYMGGMGGYLSRRHHMKAWDRAIDKIKGPRLREYAEKYRAYANSPQEEYALLRQFGFLYYIAGNIATAFVNTTQVAVMTMPALSMVAGPVKAARHVSRAYKDAIMMFGRPSKTGLQMFDPSKAPADIREELEAAWGKGAFVPLETFEVIAASRIRHAGQRRLRRGFEKGVQVTAYAFTAAERLNRLVTFIAAARLAKDPKVEAKARKVLRGNYHARASVLANWAPETFAEYIIDETQYRMGKANRPTIMRGLGSAIMQFKSFMLQTLETWYRWSTQQGWEGKMSAASSIAMLVALGGLWGFPGAEDLKDLIEKLWKKLTKEDKDLETDLRIWIYEKTNQRWLAEGVTKGAPYPLGLDMSRVGMGQIMPDNVSGVFGIPYDMFIGRPSRVMNEINNENYAAAAGHASPNFLRNILGATDWALNGVNDGRGRQMLLPDEVPATAIAQKGLGFQPSIVTDIRDSEWAQYRDEKRIYELKKHYTDKLARRMALMLRAEKDGEGERVAEIEGEIEELYAEVQQHNSNADPEDIIKISTRSLNSRIERELGGVKVTWGREGRSAARGSAQRIRDTFGLEEKLGLDE